MSMLKLEYHDTSMPCVYVDLDRFNKSNNYPCTLASNYSEYNQIIGLIQHGQYGVVLGGIGETNCCGAIHIVCFVVDIYDIDYKEYKKTRKYTYLPEPLRKTATATILTALSRNNWKGSVHITMPRCNPLLSLKKENNGLHYVVEFLKEFFIVDVYEYGPGLFFLSYHPKGETTEEMIQSRHNAKNAWSEFK